MEVLKQVIRLMKRIEGAFCPWSYLDQMDYFQQGGCNEEEAYAYANSNMGRSARYYPHYQMWVSHLVNRLIKAGIITCEYETAELRMEDGKDETIDLYQIAIFIKQIAFASMEVGVSKETIDQVVPAAVGKSWELASKLLLDPMEGMKLAVELFDHGNNSLKLYGMLLRNYRVAKKALLLSDMKENEILKLLGLTEKQMRGIRAYRKLPEERLDTVMSILIEAMNRTKISFGNERNLFIQTMAKLIIL